MSEGGDKTEAPTSKRRRDAEEKGDVLSSRDLATALVLAGGVGWMSSWGGALVTGSGDVLARGLRLSSGDLAHFDPGNAIARLIFPLFLPMAALCALTVAGAIASPFLLGSIRPRWGAAAFKASRINPAAGIKRMFGAQGLIELAKSLAKVVLIGVVGWLIAVRASVPVGGGVRSAEQFAGDLAGDLIGGSLWLTAGLVLIALIDAPVQAMQRTKRLRMSKQEVRDEAKQSDGSPETKAQQRRRRHELLSASTRRGVAEASVILTNPVHIAVALRYRPGEDRAPIVVARGKGATAEAVRLLAAEARVPILPYPQLARAIYFTSRDGHPIDEGLYRAVALVLAFVMRMDARAASAVPPTVEVPDDLRFDPDGRREMSGHA